MKQLKTIEYTRGQIYLSLVYLSLFSLIMITSAGASDGMAYFKRQIVFILLGFILIIVIERWPTFIWIALAPIVYLGAIGTILLLKTPMGVSVNGATRWLDLGFTNYQVAEGVKIGVFLMTAYFMQKYGKTDYNKKMLTGRIWFFGGLAAILIIIISSDLSSGILILGVFFLLTAVYTKTEGLHFLAFAGGACFAVGFILDVFRNMPPANATPDEYHYRTLRIAAWLDPKRYSLSAAFQTLQSQYGIGQGGFFGVGLGNGSQKLHNVSEAHTDFIFSVIGQELGLFGCLILFIGYLYFLTRIWKVVRKTKKLHLSVLCAAVFFHFSCQALINVAVNVGVFPNTGIPFPFLSYGGTAVVCQFFEVGLVLAIHRENLEEAEAPVRERKPVVKRKTSKKQVRKRA